jgi:5-bromo-4-chloroindolyl phosphate hydrolysis protein
MAGAGRTGDGGTGTVDLVAGLAGAVFAPLATFGLDVPIWASLPGAALVFLGTRLVLAPRQLFEGFDLTSADRATVELARDVLTDAQAELDALRSCAREAREPAIRDRLNHLHAIAARVVAEVEAKPRRVNAVRRLLTYYLPSAVRLARGHEVLARAHAPDRERLAASAAMIGRLDQVFERQADRVSAEEVDGLDVELRLLDEAIRAEETRALAARPAPAGA